MYLWSLHFKREIHLLHSINTFLRTFHILIQLYDYSNVINKGTNCGIQSNIQPLNPLMMKKNSRIAAKNLQNSEESTNEFPTCQSKSLLTIRMAIKSSEGSTGDWAFIPYYEISLLRVREKSHVILFSIFVFLNYFEWIALYF